MFAAGRERARASREYRLIATEADAFVVQALLRRHLAEPGPAVARSAKTLALAPDA